MSSEAVQDVLRLEGILKRSGLSAERLLLQIALCGEHDEKAYSLRFPRAMRFLHGSAEGGRVIERFGDGRTPTASTSPRPLS